MLVEKREGYFEEYKPVKIINAIKKVFEELNSNLPHNVLDDIVTDIDFAIMDSKSVTVEDIQDMVEDALIHRGYLKEAKAYIKYRENRAKARELGWDMDELQMAIWQNKYRYNDETFDEWVERVSGGDKRVGKLIRQKKFTFAGRILAHRGLQKDGKRVTFSNCYVMSPPEDNIESIFETSKELARTYSAGGGCGVDISKLRPKGMAVNNSARTTSGATSFMSLYDLTTGLIGQNGRRGALMISMDVHHPDVMDFINIKTKPDSITKANISLRVSDDFMNAVVDNQKYLLRWSGEGQPTYLQEVSARDVFKANAKNNWDWAEAGFLFWDRIKSYHLQSEHPHHEFAGVNPCAEEPLMAGGSCLLGSVNLSEFVLRPFTDRAEIDMDKFKDAVRTGVIALNDVLDEGLKLHPLEIQRKNAEQWRQIGLGPMGLGELFIKMGIEYGSPTSIMLSNTLGFIMADTAIMQSALLAKEHGAFPMYDEEATFKSEFFLRNTREETRKLVRKYGLRNSQILTIAPTGSISTMWGISGGVEPIFAKSYKRKTESLHGVDVTYDVYTPIVLEAMTKLGVSSVPSYIVTAHDIPWQNRIKMQSVWQKHIDASISSTVNLPNSATVEDCESLFISAWEHGLKGVTIYRDGCKRSGILTLDNDDVESNDDIEVENQLSNSYAHDSKFKTCPECGEPIEVIQGACAICMNCGSSPCS